MAKITLGCRKEFKNSEFVRSVLAELILTFIFVFAGVSSTIATGKMVGGANSLIGLTAGAATNVMLVSVMIAAGLDLSAGVVNPAVTIGLVVTGFMTVVRSIFYVMVQLLASVTACLLLKYIFDDHDIPIHSLGEGTKPLQGVIMETLLTFVMVLCNYILVVNPTKGVMSGLSPLLVGLIVGANTLAGGSISGASMNPARSFGPAFASWNWINHWVYWVGPFIGSALGGFVYEHIFMPKSTTYCSLSSDEESPR